MKFISYYFVLNGDKKKLHFLCLFWILIELLYDFCFLFFFCIFVLRPKQLLIVELVCVMGSKTHHYL